MLFQKLLTQINNIDEKSVIEQRKIILQPLIDYINLKHNNREEVRLNFICTHNSRRSHLAQVWAQTIAQYFNLRQVFCYSGGTESTSLYIAAVKALKQFGFEIDVIADNDNPVYSIKYSLTQSPIIGFSKSSLEEVIKDKENGFLAKKKNSLNLYNKINEFLCISKKKKKKLNKNIKILTNKLKKINYTKQLIDLYSVN